MAHSAARMGNLALPSVSLGSMAAGASAFLVLEAQPAAVMAAARQRVRARERPTDNKD